MANLGFFKKQSSDRSHKTCNALMNDGSGSLLLTESMIFDPSLSILHQSQTMQCRPTVPVPVCNTSRIHSFHLSVTL